MDYKIQGTLLSMWESRLVSNSLFGKLISLGEEGGYVYTVEMRGGFIMYW